MKPDELIKEVMEDYSQLLSKTDYLRKSIKRNKVELIDYKSCNNNIWKIHITGGRKVHIILYFTFYNSNRGMNIIQIYTNGSIAHFSAHLIKRYRERYHKTSDILLHDLAVELINNNSVGSVEEHIDEYDNKITTFSRFGQGTLLGEKYNIGNKTIYYFKTYISDDLQFKEQKNLSEKLDKQLDVYKSKFTA